MTSGDGERIDVAGAAKHLSDLSAAKPPAAPSPAWQPAWRRRLGNPTARLIVFSLMTIDGVANLAVGSAGARPLGVVFVIGGPVAAWQAWRERRKSARGG